MTIFNISLSDSMLTFVDEQVKQKGYSTAIEYIHYLIRQEQEREEQKRLETILLDGLDSGEPIEISEQWWNSKREGLIQQFNQP
jgi:antitoxin ParD1/3/4